ncbi:MAG: hypothetical protein RRY55_01200 [Bacteroidales bacterium]
METTINKRAQLLRRVHVLFGNLAMGESDRLAVLGGYGVVSCRELTDVALLDLCVLLGMLDRGRRTEVDLWRKRVMAAIGGLLREEGRECSARVIISIACRAAGVQDFNRIGVDRLRSLYNAFTKRGRDLREVSAVMEEVLMGML